MEREEILKKVKINLDIIKEEKEKKVKSGDSFEFLNKKLDSLNEIVSDLYKVKKTQEIQNLEKSLKILQDDKMDMQQEKNVFVSSFDRKIKNLTERLFGLDSGGNESKKSIGKTAPTKVQAKIGDILELSLGTTKSFQNLNVIGRQIKDYQKDFMFRIKDFQKSDKTVLSSEVKFPYRFKTVAFSEGTWHETEYPWDVIKEGASKIVGSSLVTFHVGDNDTILTEVGHITDFELDENAKQLIVDCEVFDTSAGKDIAVLHANKRIPAVSVRLTEDSEMGVCKKIIAWPHVAIVREGEVSDAKPIYDND